MRNKTVLEWSGHKIEFVPILSRKTFWLATLNEVWVDGQLVAKSGGFNLSSRAEGTFKHGSNILSISVESSTCFKSLIDLNYSMIIDGELISSGIAKTQIQW